MIVGILCALGVFALVFAGYFFKDLSAHGKLIIAVVVNFVLSALQSAGIGMYAPSMAMVYVLGMSPRVAFPIMMASAAFTLPPASIKFIKEGAYNKKASLAITVSGIVGVFIAIYIVKSLPVKMLIWLVIVVIGYTAIALLLREQERENNMSGKKDQA